MNTRYESLWKYLPSATRLIFNLKTEEKVKNEDGTKSMRPLEHPVLTTIMYFADDTKVVVKNSLHDKIDLETKTLPNGKEVTVASEASKESGLVYAIAKRIFGIPDMTGNIKGEGFGNILKRTVDNAIDQPYESELIKYKNAKAKAEHLAKQANAKPKEPRPSLAKTVSALAEQIKSLQQVIDNLPKA